MESLRQVSLEILDVNRPSWSLAVEVAGLTELLSEGAAFQIDPTRDVSDGETRTANGLALSPTQAAMCAADARRTVTFIRGLHRAISDVREFQAHRPARVLYAGCGPYALLAIPLMTVWSSDEVRFTLLDIHQQSLHSARSIVDELNFGVAVARFEQIDACCYRIPRDAPPDIIVSETMNACLEKEPQVTIVRNLLAQVPQAILLPESVAVDACLVNVSREFAFVTPGHEVDSPDSDRDRIPLGSVFELSAESARTWSPEDSEQLPGSRIRIPQIRTEIYDPLLFTRIRVYRDFALTDYDSGLTVPRPFPFAGQLKGGETLQFHYRLGPYPGLLCQEAV